MRFLICAALLALVGCNATMPQARRPGPADDPTSHCYQQLASDQRFAALTSKIGSVAGFGGTSVEMLASNEKPTDEERRLISVWGVARQTCNDQGRQFRAQYAPPGWPAAFDAGQNSMLALMARLYSGELTYGQFNRERQELAARTRAALGATADRAVAADLQRAQQEQLSTVQNLQIMQMLQAQQQANRPVMPSLSQPEVNCTSRAAGGTVFTSCR